MGGAVAEGNMTPAAEFNIWADPEAAQRVFHSGIDVTMIGLDVTHGALLTPEWSERFRRAGRVGTFVAELVEFFKQYHARTYGWDGAPIHDAVARRARAAAGTSSARSTSTSRWRPSRTSAGANRRRPLAPHRTRAECARGTGDRRRCVLRAPARAHRDARLMPPGLGRLAVASLGAAALAVGLVAALNGVLGGIVIAFGGIVLLVWSVFGR